MNRIDNLKRRRSARAALVLVPTLFAILGPVGIVASPVLRFGKTELELAGFTQESEKLRASIEEHGDLVDERALENARTKAAKINSLIPAPCSPVLLHTLVRLLSRSVHLSLESIAIGGLTDPGLERLEDYIGAREVQLHGNGSIQSLIALPTTLGSLGFPNAVSAIDISRPSIDETEFTFSLTLYIFECATPPPEDSPSSASSTEGP